MPSSFRKAKSPSAVRTIMKLGFGIFVVSIFSASFFNDTVPFATKASCNSLLILVHLI